MLIVSIVIIAAIVIDVVAFNSWYHGQAAMASARGVTERGKHTDTLFIVIGGINRDTKLQIQNLEARHHLLYNRGATVYVNSDGDLGSEAPVFREDKVVEVACKAARAFHDAAQYPRIVFIATSMGIRAAFRAAVILKQEDIKTKCLAHNATLRAKDLKFGFRLGTVAVGLALLVPFVHWIFALKRTIPRALAAPIAEEQYAPEVLADPALGLAIVAADARSKMTKFLFFATQAASFLSPLPVSNNPWSGPNDIVFLRSEHDNTVGANAPASLTKAAGHEVKVMDIFGSWHASASMQPDANAEVWRRAFNFLAV